MSNEQNNQLPKEFYLNLHHAFAAFDREVAAFPGAATASEAKLLRDQLLRYLDHYVAESTPDQDADPNRPKLDLVLAFGLARQAADQTTIGDRKIVRHLLITLLGLLRSGVVEQGDPADQLGDSILDILANDEQSRLEQQP